MYRLVRTLAVCSALALVGIAAAEKKKDTEGKKRERPTAEAIFKRMDADGDGKVTLEEFKKFHADMRARFREKADKDGRRGKGRERLSEEERFKRIDANNDGVISLEEFKKAFREFGPPGKGGKKKEEKPDAEK